MFHTKKITKTFTIGCLLTIFILISSCSDDKPTTPPSPNDKPNKTTGFIATRITSTGKTVKYFEELPTETVDLSSGQDFPVFTVRSIFDNAIFTPRTDKSSGFSKMVVNSEGKIVEVGSIATSIPRNLLGIRDSETGVFQSGANSRVINTFNPKTFEVTGSIDMSHAKLPGDVLPRYNSFQFRGNDLFVNVREESGKDFKDHIVIQANLTTNTYVGATKREGNGRGKIRLAINEIQNLKDKEGNLYIPDEGNFTGAGIAGRINKIPMGSNDIDPTYVLEPSNELNRRNLFLPTFNRFTILKNGKAVALVNRDVPQEALDIVKNAGGLANLSGSQRKEIQSILFKAESAVWCEIDLNNKSVTPIAGIPNLGVFAGGTVFEHGGNAYLPVDKTSENAYYKFNPTTGNVSKAFVIIGEGNVRFFNIANNI